MKCYGYVLTARADDDAGIGEQRAEIERACEEQGGLELRRFFEDRGSGLSEPWTRRGWRDFLREVGRGDVLIITAFDGITRNAHSLLVVLGHLRRMRVQLIITNQD